MADLKAMPKREWATSEEVVGTLEKLLELARAGEIVSVAYVANQRDGQYRFGASRIENRYEMAAHLIHNGMVTMGFKEG
jgi:hypothetical protein